jgi:orotate phosphoribosyltransferase
MASTDLGALLQESGAILKGHFILTSGRHSDTYFEKFRVLEQPAVLSALTAEIAGAFRNERIDLVAGPTTGGIIIAFEVARQLETQAVYVESVDGVRTLRRGAQIPTSARVLIVDDVLTTGTSIREVAELIASQGGIVAGVAVLIDRSEVQPDFGAPIFCAHRVLAQSWPEEAIPEWLAAIPAVKPGTRANPTG